MSDLTGNVFNIQKFSLHDGPGIRTVVFLKGCPLRCKWCANPESQRPEPQIMRDPVQGEQVSGQRRTVSQVMEVCLQDLDFYEESGGGVTLSGGEPLLQPSFAAALIHESKARRIHTAMETTGYAEPAVFNAATAEVDLLLFDIKHWNSDRHRAGTGVDDRRILENLSHAIRTGKEVLPRLPVIPGFNDTPEDAAGFVARLQEAGASRVQLLPFHQFGENKYAMLGQQYAYADVPALHEEDLTAFRQVFLEAGIDASF